jgi:hypothetical protein
VTGVVAPSQVRVCTVGALVASVHEPGPRSGTSTDSKPGARLPASSPLNAFAFELDTTGLTLEVVTAE